MAGVPTIPANAAVAADFSIARRDKSACISNLRSLRIVESQFASAVPDRPGNVMFSVSAGPA
jgi:hypothetical protein